MGRPSVPSAPDAWATWAHDPPLRVVHPRPPRRGAAPVRRDVPMLQPRARGRRVRRGGDGDRAADGADLRPRAPRPARRAAGDPRAHRPTRRVQRDRRAVEPDVPRPDALVGRRRARGGGPVLRHRPREARVRRPRGPRGRRHGVPRRDPARARRGRARRRRRRADLRERAGRRPRGGPRPRGAVRRARSARGAARVRGRRRRRGHVRGDAPARVRRLPARDPVPRDHGVHGVAGVPARDRRGDGRRHRAHRAPVRGPGRGDRDGVRPPDGHAREPADAVDAAPPAVQALPGTRCGPRGCCPAARAAATRTGAGGRPGRASTA